MKKNQIKSWILSRLVIWRIALILVALFAIQTIPFKASFPYWEFLLEPNGHPLLWSWGNFDGVHYLTIAMQGYTAQYTQAFFPFYPIFIRYLSGIIGSELISGLTISHLMFFIAVLLLYKLVRIDWGQSSAKRAIIYLMLFPTSYYFVSLYSESLFMALVLGSFYAARRKKWWIAGLLAAIASATRIFGAFLLPALLIEWYVQRGEKKKFAVSELVNSIIPISLSLSGLLLYMNYLKNAFSDPFLFISSQPAFGAQRSADKLILLYQVFWRYIKMAITVDPKSLLYYTVSLEALSGVLFLVLSLIALKKTRLSYALFGILAYITPTLTGTLSSMPRYVLILFPCFILLGQVKSLRFQRIWWFFSAILLAINTALFIRGYWVA